MCRQRPWGLVLQVLRLCRHCSASCEVLCFVQCSCPTVAMEFCRYPDVSPLSFVKVERPQVCKRREELRQADFDLGLELRASRMSCLLDRIMGNQSEALPYRKLCRCLMDASGGRMSVHTDLRNHQAEVLNLPSAFDRLDINVNTSTMEGCC